MPPISPVAMEVAAPEPMPSPARKSPLRMRVKVVVSLPWPTDWKGAWELLLAEEQGFLAKPPDKSTQDQLIRDPCHPGNR